jgi:hypothetical protein
VEVPIKQLDGFLRISRIDKCKMIFEINLHGTVSLPPEEKLAEAQRCKEDMEEGSIVP